MFEKKGESKNVSKTETNHHLIVNGRKNFLGYWKRWLLLVKSEIV